MNLTSRYADLRERLSVVLRKSSRSAKSTWLLAIALTGFMAYYLDAREVKAEATDAPTTEVATEIPAGFVLVPIEVANYESLDSILGSYGLVDLYLPPDETHKRAVKVASHLKILRAPLNPSHFAVLVPEDDSPKLVSRAGAFTVVVQNPDRAHGTGIVNKLDAEHTPRRVKVASRIQVENPYGPDDRENSNE